MFKGRTAVIYFLVITVSLITPVLLAAQSATVPIGKQLELTAGVGYLSPSFKNWNDGIALHTTNLNEKTYQTSGSVGELGSNSLYQFQIKYHFNPLWSLALSVGHFETDANTSYSLAATEELDFWPNYTVDQQLAQTFSQDIRINPTMLTLALNIPYSSNENLIDMYIGGGVGYMFSRIQNKVESNNILSLHSAKGALANYSFDMNNELMAHLSANVNPVTYCAMTGMNLKYGIINLNLEVGYQFARATIDEDDWTYFSQHDQTQWNDFGLKDLVDGAFESRWWNMFNERDYFTIPESQFDDLKIDELKLDGFIFKANAGFAF